MRRLNHRKRLGVGLIVAACLCLGLGTAGAQETEVEKAVEAALSSSHRLVVVVGAEGEPEYGKQFSEWANSWQQVARDAGWQWQQIGGQEASESNDLQKLKQEIEAWNQSPDEASMSYVLVLIGHGTAQKGEAKFNLRGPDLSAKELANWMAPIHSQVVVIQCASSSASFINRLSGKDRLIVTATKNEQESNFCRFGGFLPKAMLDPASDLDHDDQVSLVEAVIRAANQTREFYEAEDRIQTEHALLDDNGDTLGSPVEALAAMMRGETPEIKQAREDKQNKMQIVRSWDGVAAARFVFPNSNRTNELLATEETARVELENELTRLRQIKSTLDEGQYYEQLELSLVKLAQLYEEVDKRLEKEPKSP